MLRPIRRTWFTNCVHKLRLPLPVGFSNRALCNIPNHPHSDHSAINRNQTQHCHHPPKRNRSFHLKPGRQCSNNVRRTSSVQLRGVRLHFGALSGSTLPVQPNTKPGRAAVGADIDGDARSCFVQAEFWIVSGRRSGLAPLPVFAPRTSVKCQ